MSQTNPRPPRRRSLLYRAIKWITILYALLLAAELSLTVVFGLGNPILYRYDPACAYLPAPDQQVRRFFAENDTNSFGMRSPQVSAHKPSGMLRVMVVGDSVTYGTSYVDQSKIFTSILGRELPSQLHRPVEVLNASAGAWAPANELGYLESRGTFDADVVIFVLNTGDLVQPMNHPTLMLANGYPDRRPPFALYELWVRYLRPRLFHERSGVDAGSTADKPDVEHETPRVLATLDEACSFARSRGAEFRIVYTVARGGDWGLPDYARALAMLHAWAKDHQVPLLDLTSELSAGPIEDVYQDGIHLRSLGDRIVADAIARKWSWPASSPTSRPAP